MFPPSLTPTSANTRPSSLNMADKYTRYTSQDLSDTEAKRLLGKFAKLRCLFILPFGFLRNVELVRSATINCLFRTTWKWRVDEQVKLYRTMPFSAYRNLARDHANRTKPPDTFVRKSTAYIVPGTQSEQQCRTCHGHRLTDCPDCHGQRFTGCESCQGRGFTMEEPECPACDGTGTLVSTTTITRRKQVPDGFPHDEDVVTTEATTEQVCPHCLGTGKLRARPEECYFCDGTGEIRCEVCDGTGKVECR